MTEAFLLFVWQYQYFIDNNLSTTNNQVIRVFHTGNNNINAGADFLEARIQIGDIEWFGSVEIHIKSSDWLLHKHEHNMAFENVILHVVWEDDHTIVRNDGSKIPTLELKNNIDSQLMFQYESLIEAKYKIPCAYHFKNVDHLYKIHLLDRMLIERIEEKSVLVNELLIQNNYDWEETTYQLLAKNFGFKVNSETFLMLSQRIPLKILLKHADNLFQIEALLFGVGGFLDTTTATDEYQLKLQKEFNYLGNKYNLHDNKIALHQWKFLRLRPANFPTVRIAQFAKIIKENIHLFSLFTHFENIQTFKKIFLLSPSSYWQNHYIFGKPCYEKDTVLGKSSYENILINTVVPLLYCFAKNKNLLDNIQKALSILENIPSEKNNITNSWEELGLKVKTSFDSQALIQLYNNYCSHKKCLSCTIGKVILKQSII